MNQETTFKTVMFKNGKTLEITQEQATKIASSIARVGIEQNYTFWNDHDSLLLTVNCAEIVYIQ